jgi:hypothetical protein
LRAEDRVVSDEAGETERVRFHAKSGFQRPRKVEVERPSVAVHVADLVDGVIQGVGA